MNDITTVVFFLVFLFGLAMGSFLNVVIYRSRSGASLGGRSKCLACARPLRAKMLVPLFSYIIQLGRCAYCGVKISLQYPLVEATLGVLFVLVLVVHGFDPLHASLFEWVAVALDATIWTTLLAITVYDLKHKIIPDSFSLALALIAGTTLIMHVAFGDIEPSFTPLLASGAFPWWLDLLAGPAIALPFALLWFFSGGRAMGLGDAKLAWGLGWFLGFASGITAVIFAFWIAFFPSLFLLLMPKKRFTMKSEIPFAPFLVLGTLVTYVSGLNILNWTF